MSSISLLSSWRYYNIGLIYQCEGELDRATKSFKNAIKINPNLSMAYYNLGVIKAKQNNKKDACRYWGKGSDLGNAESKRAINLLC